MAKRVLLSFCTVLLCSLCAVAQTKNVAGQWRGVWTNQTGFVYSAEMTLETGPGCKTCAVSGEGSVRGKIVWTLKKIGSNATPEYANKVGMTATEYIKGEIVAGGFLILNGYDKDDPNNVIGIDKYRLAISDDGQVIGGITYNNGPWTGQFIVARI